MRLSTRLKEIHKYFLPKARFRRVPNQLISPYVMKGADQHERLLMKYGVARNPQEARLLMDKHKTKTAWETMDKMPVRTIPFIRKLKYRLIRLIRTYEGHDPRNPYKLGGAEIDIKYKYKR